MHIRRLLFLLGLAILAGVSTRAFAAGFPDSDGTIYGSAFSYLAEKGFIQGYPDGSGRPGSPLNRVEALKVILNIEGKSAVIDAKRRSMPEASMFSDVDQSAWYAPYVEVAFDEYLVTGYPDGTMRPGQLLRVEEAVALLMRTISADRGPTSQVANSPYIENRGGEWFTSAINAVIEKNLVMHAGTLRLGTAITRGEFFDMAFRLHTIRESGEAAYRGAEPRQDYAVVDAFDGSTSFGSEKYFAITMPSLEIYDLAITHPDDPFSKDGILRPLQYGVGHLFGYPGGGGKIMIYGHSSGYPWDVSEFTKIFRQINRLQVGDRVYVTYAGSIHVYEITGAQTVSASDTSAFDDDGTGEELILYTCWPPDSVSQRYLVHAMPVETIAGR